MKNVLDRDLASIPFYQTEVGIFFSSVFLPGEEKNPKAIGEAVSFLLQYHHGYGDESAVARMYPSMTSAMVPHEILFAHAEKHQGKKVAQYLRELIPGVEEGGSMQYASDKSLLDTQMEKIHIKILYDRQLRHLQKSTANDTVVIFAAFCLYHLYYLLYREESPFIQPFFFPCMEHLEEFFASFGELLESRLKEGVKQGIPSMFFSKFREVFKPKEDIPTG